MKNFIYLILLIPSIVFSKNDDNNWEGEYNYLLTSDNPNHVWHYDLRVVKEEGGYSAKFEVWGHQTFWPMKCIVIIADNKALFYFEDYTEPPGMNDLKRGDLVLTLEYNNYSLISTWSDVIRISDNLPKDGFDIMKKK